MSTLHWGHSHTAHGRAVRTPRIGELRQPWVKGIAYDAEAVQGAVDATVAQLVRGFGYEPDGRGEYGEQRTG